MRLSTRRVVWVRTVAGVLALISLAGVLGMQHREAGLRTGGGWFACVGSGCVQMGVNQVRFSPGWVAPEVQTGGFYFMRAWHDDWLTAWRPFRVRFAPTVNGQAQHFVVAPLWPVVLGSIGVFGWSAGLLSGLRRARGTQCVRCGYELKDTPVSEGKRCCPECGTRQRARDAASLTAVA